MRVLVTGGAGFIGGHLAERFVSDGHQVVILDDLSTGFRENVPEGARLVVGDVADMADVRTAMEGVELVFHQAASRAVFRSVQDPIGTNDANVGGSLNVLVAARDAGARRVLLASSSSVYGGVAPLPTREDARLSPKSPYAVSKLASEHYARVFWELYGLETVTLRYFNVFGPRQRPDSPYAAVIPLFIDALASGKTPQIHGDGLQSRDFTFIDDVVTANLLAAEAPAEVVAGDVYNVARGESTPIIEILAILKKLMNVEAEPEFVDSRPGDVHLSQADVSKAREALGLVPSINVEDGLVRSLIWYESSRTTTLSAERSDLL